MRCSTLFTGRISPVKPTSPAKKKSLSMKFFTFTFIISEDKSIVSQGIFTNQITTIAILNALEKRDKTNITHYMCNSCGCDLKVEGNDRPTVCFNCRKTLDWNRYNTKICPNCNRKYDNPLYHYCGYCNLELKEFIKI